MISLDKLDTSKQGSIVPYFSKLIELPQNYIEFKAYQYLLSKRLGSSYWLSNALSENYLRKYSPISIEDRAINRQAFLSKIAQLEEKLK